MYVVGFNGPPEAGKDSIANCLAEQLPFVTNIPVRVASIVEPLARMGALLLGVEYSDAWYVATKSQPQDIFNGDTLREWMIRITEDFFKPRYGELFWDHALVNQLESEGFEGILLVTNIGFDYEAEFFQTLYNPENCLFIQVSREKKTFDKDSRTYVGGEHNLGLHNEEGKVGLEICYHKIISRLLLMGWLKL